ncbi:hypothetical protein [Pseudocolwellia agarivorans]|uniref:hypothetical protein n=1 Tax=Pseudocolwellia agarivorans TaxID=1911682 RepID=UPI0009859F12|nr:hypothetical protein [Pseudocolwellia agarivorans]
MNENRNLKPSPKSFLKSRRPERFSDSVIKDVGRLDRSVLEYQLSILNRRSMELAFEDFSKQLCERIICPNLLEQTGPVAGGDGKVDSQTFPVSEQLKDLWYVGVNDNSNDERWAFAVSTQEDWKAKCRKDVRKIKATDRNYKKAFFVTNMYAKANQRSDLEDSLSKETGIDVRILDRSWILDQIFNNGYEQLAIDTLSIDIDWRREVEVGASDYSKKLRLKEIKKEINEKVNVSQILPHQLNWMLEEAVLSKELENPLIETQGLFDRAIRASKKHGTKHHLFTAHYQYAWASYWWFEDMTLFEENLLKCIELAKGIEQSVQWGNVLSLLSLYSSYYREDQGKYETDIAPIQKDIQEVLLKLSLRGERPSNSLMCRAYIELIYLLTTESIEEASEVFSSLLLIVKEGDCLVGFPFNELYNLVNDLDSVFGDLVSYELLLDYFTEQASCREGQRKGSLLLLKRGARRLESGEPYQAIKLIGKSLTGLYKKEAKKDLYAGLNILSRAYQKVGLFWAARANLLLAASIITDEFWRSGELIVAQVYIYTRLAKIELLIGRLNYALSWWKLACMVDSNVEESVMSERELHSFDAFLSQCILNTEHNKLSSFSKLPDLLDRNQLFVSRSVLLYALGYEDIVEGEYELKIDQEYIEYLQIVRDVELGAIVPILLVCEGKYTHLKSSVMGCEIKISFPFRTPLVELAETLLSVLEGFFSTCIVDHVIVFESRLDIEIIADDEDEIAISHEIDSSNSILKMEVTCSSFTADMLNLSGQHDIQKWLNRFVIDVFSHVMRPQNTEVTLESMLGNDRALERSISFGKCFVGLQNVMGNNAVIEIKELLMDDKLSEYCLKRPRPWDEQFPKKLDDNNQETHYYSDNNESPESLTNNEHLSHNDMKIQNLIKTRLWDRTVWGGTGFSIHQDGTPELMLLFEDDKAAQLIFEDLIREVGHEDHSNRMKISIIRNIDQKSPSHYRICISERFNFDTSKRVQMNARKMTMTPTTTENLDRFLANYNTCKNYLVSYAVIKNGNILPPSSKKISIIKKFDIKIIDAWEIGPNDIEIMVLDKKDDPIIPRNIKKPPIIEALKRKFS